MPEPEKKFFSKVVVFTFQADNQEDADNEGQWIIDKLGGRWYPHEDFEHLPVQEEFPAEISLNGKKFVFDGHFTYKEQS